MMADLLARVAAPFMVAIIWLLAFYIALSPEAGLFAAAKAGFVAGIAVLFGAFTAGREAKAQFAGLPAASAMALSFFVFAAALLADAAFTQNIKSGLAIETLLGEVSLGAAIDVVIKAAFALLIAAGFSEAARLAGEGEGEA